MNGSTAAELRQQLQRYWARGELLRDSVTQTVQWPLRLSLKSPRAADLANHFEQVRAWVAQLAETPHIRIEWNERMHRVQGRQRLPAAVYIDDLPTALAWLGKARAASQYVQLWEQAARLQPQSLQAGLQEWLLKRPIKALELADCWPQLMAVVLWLRAHPQPNVYLRQVDIPDVDSKFIETHRKVLAELIDQALPRAVCNPKVTGTAHFARRYGFAEKPLRIRFRLLDVTIPSLPGCAGGVDISVDAANFARLQLAVQRVFITENETNFLAFPGYAGALVIFGSGYGWEALAQAQWLQHCPLYYWGDLDTHGFAILNQLRGYFPHVQSILMDRKTLLAHRHFWGREADPVRHTLPRLTAAEAALYDELRYDRLQPQLRLEQERIGYAQVLECLHRMAQPQAD